MQRATRRGTGARDIACVLRNLWLDQYDMEHLSPQSLSILIIAHHGLIWQAFCPFPLFGRKVFAYKADASTILTMKARLRQGELSMQFEKTKTYQNLASSFAGECQAGMRYQMTAKLAMQEDLKCLSDAIRTIAKNETFHATQFFNKMIEKTGSRDTVEFDAGYPFHAGTLVEGLKFASMDEKNESEDIYPSFAETAKKEGFEDISALYKMVAEVEKQHKLIFQYLCDSVKNGTLYKSERPLLWICSECGYMHVAEEAWKICPLCKAGQGYVDLHLPFEGTRK